MNCELCHRYRCSPKQDNLTKRQHIKLENPGKFKFLQIPAYEFLDLERPSQSFLGWLLYPIIVPEWHGEDNERLAHPRLPPTSSASSKSWLENDVAVVTVPGFIPRCCLNRLLIRSIESKLYCTGGG